eukprot:6210610-Pleurochrysis_carterae.AAC.1
MLNNCQWWSCTRAALSIFIAIKKQCTILRLTTSCNGRPTTANPQVTLTKLCGETLATDAAATASNSHGDL